MTSILNPDTTPYELIGGEAGVRELVDRFYDHMRNQPEAHHGESLRIFQRPRE